MKSNWFVEILVSIFCLCLCYPAQAEKVEIELTGLGKDNSGRYELYIVSVLPDNRYEVSDKLIVSRNSSTWSEPYYRQSLDFVYPSGAEKFVFGGLYFDQGATEPSGVLPVQVKVPTDGYIKSDPGIKLFRKMVGANLDEKKRRAFEFSFGLQSEKLLSEYASFSSCIQDLNDNCPDTIIELTSALEIKLLLGILPNTGDAANTWEDLFDTIQPVLNYSLSKDSAKVRNRLLSLVKEVFRDANPEIRLSYYLILLHPYLGNNCLQDGPEGKKLCDWVLDEFDAVHDKNLLSVLKAQRRFMQQKFDQGDSYDLVLQMSGLILTNMTEDLLEEIDGLKKAERIVFQREFAKTMQLLLQSLSKSYATLPGSNEKNKGEVIAFSINSEVNKSYVSIFESAFDRFGSTRLASSSESRANEIREFAKVIKQGVN